LRLPPEAQKLAGVDKVCCTFDSNQLVLCSFYNDTSLTYD